MSEDLSPALRARALDDSVTYSEGFSALRKLVAQHGTSSRDEVSPLIRPAVAQIASESRSGGLGVTELVVQLKAQWFLFPEVQRLARRDGQSLLDSVVTLLIQEYFRESSQTA
jgi:hypothetical protein